MLWFDDNNIHRVHTSHIVSYGNNPSILIRNWELRLQQSDAVAIDRVLVGNSEILLSTNGLNDFMN